MMGCSVSRGKLYGFRPEGCLDASRPTGYSRRRDSTNMGTPPLTSLRALTGSTEHRASRRPDSNTTLSYTTATGHTTRVLIALQSPVAGSKHESRLSSGMSSGMSNRGNFPRYRHRDPESHDTTFDLKTSPAPGQRLSSLKFRPTKTCSAASLIRCSSWRLPLWSPSRGWRLQRDLRSRPRSTSTLSMAASLWEGVRSTFSVQESPEVYSRY